MNTQQRPTDEQERMRLDGLRILARIIARHALAQPRLHADGSPGDRDVPSAVDQGSARSDGAA